MCPVWCQLSVESPSHDPAAVPYAVDVDAIVGVNAQLGRLDGNTTKIICHHYKGCHPVGVCISDDINGSYNALHHLG